MGCCWSKPEHDIGDSEGREDSEDTLGTYDQRIYHINKFLCVTTNGEQLELLLPTEDSIPAIFKYTVQRIRDNASTKFQASFKIDDKYITKNNNNLTLGDEKMFFGVNETKKGYYYFSLEESCLCSSGNTKYSSYWTVEGTTINLQKGSLGRSSSNENWFALLPGGDWYPGGNNYACDNLHQ